MPNIIGCGGLIRTALSAGVWGAPNEPGSRAITETRSLEYAHATFTNTRRPAKLRPTLGALFENFAFEGAALELGRAEPRIIQARVRRIEPARVPGIHSRSDTRWVRLARLLEAEAQSRLRIIKLERTSRFVGDPGAIAYSRKTPALAFTTVFDGMVFALLARNSCMVRIPGAPRAWLRLHLKCGDVAQNTSRDCAGSHWTRRGVS